MNYIIVDNEVNAQRNLCNLVQQLQPSWKAEALLDNVESTIQWIQGHNQPDLIFMNVQLFRQQNISLLNHTCTNSSIICTTSADDQSIQVFDSNKIDYVQKPIQTERLKNLLLKYEQLNGSRVDVSNDIKEIAKVVEKNHASFSKSFKVTGSSKVNELHVNEIAYFYSMNKITFAVTYSQKEHILDVSLEKVEKQLNPELFFRTNRQTICKRDAISEYESWYNGKLLVNIEPEFYDKIIISREKAKAFKAWMMGA